MGLPTLCLHLYAASLPLPLQAAHIAHAAIPTAHLTVSRGKFSFRCTVLSYPYSRLPAFCTQSCGLPLDATVVQQRHPDFFGQEAFCVCVGRGLLLRSPVHDAAQPTDPLLRRFTILIFDRVVAANCSGALFCWGGPINAPPRVLRTLAASEGALSAPTRPVPAVRPVFATFRAPVAPPAIFPTCRRCALCHPRHALFFRPKVATQFFPC